MFHYKTEKEKWRGERAEIWQKWHNEFTKYLKIQGMIREISCSGDRSEWLLPESSPANSISSLRLDPDANSSADFHSVMGLCRS